MGLSSAVLLVANPLRPDLPPVQADALADTGSVYLVIPETIQRELQLSVHEVRDVTLADGSRRDVPYVGPVELRLGSRIGFFGAIVMGHQCLLGTIPIEDMDLVVRPLDRMVEFNPTVVPTRA